MIQRVTYSLAGQRIAVRVTGDPDPANNGLLYIHSDHLGSTSVLTKYSDGYIRTDSLTRYTPFGAYRTGGSNPLTDRAYTGQRENMELGLYYYNARYYLPGAGRFLSADTIVPNPQNPQSLNRYAYTLNSPLNYSDPTGHRPSDGCEYEGCMLPNFMNPDETWQGNNGQYYSYDPSLANKYPSNWGDKLAEMAGTTELVLDIYSQYKSLTGGKEIPGPIGTLLVGGTAAYDNRDQPLDRIAYEVVAHIAVDVAVDTYASAYAGVLALSTTEVTGNPFVGVVLGTVAFMEIQYEMNYVYGDRIEQSIDELYDYWTSPKPVVAIVNSSFQIPSSERVPTPPPRWGTPTP